MFLKQSTAFTDRIGPFLDKTDGVTEEVGLTTASTAIFLSKNGGNFVVKNDATSLVHDQDGWYVIVYDATDTATVGKLEVMIQEPATHLPVWKTYWVLEEAIYDALFATSAAAFDANQRVDVGAVLGTAQTAGDLAALVVTADAAIDVAVADLANATDGLGALKTLIDALNDVSTADLATALSDIDLDHLVNTATAIPAITAGTFLDQMFDDGTAVYDRTTDSLQALRDRGDAAWTTGGGSGLTALASGTAQSGTASTIVLAASSAFADNVLNGAVINIHTGTGAGQSRVILSNTLADDTCNITPNWTTNPSSDSQYEIVQGSANLASVSLTAQTAGDLAALITTADAAIDVAVADLANGTDGLGALKALIDTVDTVVDAIKVVTDKFAFTVANQVDSNALSVGGTTQTAGDLAALVTTLDTVADAVKLVTDKFAFTVANQVDANAIAVSGSAAVADRLEAWLGGFLTGIVEEGGGPTTTVFQTDAGEATDEHFKNSAIVFTGGALLGQARRISVYTGISGTMTVEPPLTEAPAAGDTWIVFPMVLAGIDANGRVDLGRVLGTAQTAGDLAALITTVDTAVDTIDDFVDLEVADILTRVTAVQAQLPATLTGAGNIKADMLAVNGNTDAATAMALSGDQIIVGTVATGSWSTTVFESDDITEATADHFIGRIILFTTGNLAGQATDILDYELVGANGSFTVTAVTDIPLATETFVIV
jgi:hypothetical protein